MARVDARIEDGGLRDSFDTAAILHFPLLPRGLLVAPSTPFVLVRDYRCDRGKWRSAATSIRRRRPSSADFPGNQWFRLILTEAMAQTAGSQRVGYRKIPGLFSFRDPEMKFLRTSGGNGSISRGKTGEVVDLMQFRSMPA